MVNCLIPIVVNEFMNIAGHHYQLHGSVYHNGTSVHCGHYVALSKHGTDSQSSWLYDDLGDHRPATALEVQGCLVVQGYNFSRTY